MKIHLFSTFGDKQDHIGINAANTAHDHSHEYSNDRYDAYGDKDLRSCALKSAKKGDFYVAIAVFNQLIERHPENAIDYNNRGLVYFQSGEERKAVRDFNKALQLNPTLASAYNNRANYYAASGDLEAALVDYEKALDLDPGHVRAWINRGITLRELGEYTEAIDNFETALFFGKLESHILAEKGRTYHMWGEWNVAIADYYRALEQLPPRANKTDNLTFNLRLQVETWLNQLLLPMHPEWEIEE
ncbi:tetratricopeptide repeat protein [Rivularia sp. UHCC 0363]|uniref:tetratricopeptide repeat protein n=1 Tax=Rivularia sp. UHCC 0363 TaxID=3110244 RepID=UPI002B20D765|nr:tetratricopeptide repeat protein [Rivularia sp. UHCC 0363]MEA5596274.1 tetratricopeptide repeat protein [Rivularia sp. UHCC 0363]